MEKLPPIEKIFEAYSAIADGRVAFSDLEDRATVTSSDGSKAYTVTWKAVVPASAADVYTANDNASYWQGYPGYPVIAVLMLQGRLTLNRKIAELFKDINWAKLNAEYKRDYSKAVAAVIQERGYDIETINAATDRVYAEIKGLPITMRRGSLKPPKST